MSSNIDLRYATRATLLRLKLCCTVHSFYILTVIKDMRPVFLVDGLTVDSCRFTKLYPISLRFQIQRNSTSSYMMWSIWILDSFPITLISFTHKSMSEHHIKCWKPSGMQIATCFVFSARRFAADEKIEIHCWRDINVNWKLALSVPCYYHNNH